MRKKIKVFIAKHITPSKQIMQTPHETLAQKRKRYREQVAITIPPDCMNEHHFCTSSFVDTREESRPRSERRDTFVVHGVPPAFAGAAAQDRAARTATYKIKCVNRGWIRSKCPVTEATSAHPCLGRCTFYSNFTKTMHYDCVYQNAKT